MNKHLKTGAGIAAVLLSAAFIAQAEQVILNIDPNQSILTLSGTAFGLNYAAQPGHAGSLDDRWSGTITADLTGGVLTFGPGSSITALLNTPAAPPFSTFPHADVPADSVDNYGAYAAGIVNGLNIEINGAYRTLTLDITSGTATPGTPSSGMNLAFTSGHLEWGAVQLPDRAALIDGSSSMVGVTGANTSSGIVTLTSDGVLTLPVQFSTTGDNRTEQWTGVIVAAVPEPGTITLLLLGAGAVCFNMRKARRSR